MTITITETRDPEPIWRIVTDASVFNRVCDDTWLAKSLEELRAIVNGMVTNPANHILAVLDDGVAVGCFVCYQLNAGVFEVHTFLTSKCRGKSAIEAGKNAMRFVFGLPGVQKLISYCPDCLPESFFFARRCGWKFTGMSEAKWTKLGVTYPVKAVEIAKEDVCL